jgi:hypothetical protein
MASIEVDFEWYRDADGYLLVPAEKVKPAINMLAAGAPLITFPPWLGAQPTPVKPKRIVRRRGPLEPYRPLQRFGKLFQQFAKNATSAAGVLDFIEKFGPLTNAGLDPDVGEPVAAAVASAKAMTAVLEAHSWKDGAGLTHALRGQPIILGAIEASLIADPITGNLQMRLTVPDLLRGLWVQLGQSLASGAPMRICDHCNMLFEVGPGTGRRLDAKFCSDGHRVAFNSLKRSQEGRQNA